MSKRIDTCILCAHFNLTTGQPNYSEYTPGSCATVECSKNHWTLDLEETDDDSYRRAMLTAEDCADFLLSHIAKKYSKGS